MSHQPKHLYDFGPFQLNAVERLLLRNREPVSMSPKAFDLLLTLVEYHGHLLEKDELLRQVWPDMFVEEANLSYNISLIRKALGEGENGQKFIETVPKHGYRFIAEVRELSAEEAKPAQASDLAIASTPLSRRASRSSRWVLGASVALLVLALGVYYFWSQRTVAALPITSLAVLPFKSLQSDSGDEYLGLGLADTLITKLGGLRQLIVRPTSAVRKYTNAEQDPLAAGREQQVQAVLDANLQRMGDKVRVTARLLNVSDGEIALDIPM